MSQFYKDIYQYADPQNLKTFANLGKFLNSLGHRTQRGGKYIEGGRGIAKVVLSAHNAYYHKGEHAKADRISKSFVDANGNFAF